MISLNKQQLIKNSSFINGQWTKSEPPLIPVVNPANNDVVAHVSDAGAADVELAISAASEAMPAWQQHTAQHRANILRRWFQLIIENQEDLARIITLEQGKPLKEARAEISYAAAYVDWFAEEARRVYSDVIPGFKQDVRLLTLKQAIGIVGAITPWNFPCAMVTRKVAPALAVGCAVVLKPAIETPLSALALAELAQQAGLANGLFNVVVGQDSEAIGKVLCENEEVKKLTFTGSTRVGKLLMQQSAATVKRTSMELGGNAPFIVFDDADLDLAIDGLLASKFRNAGQTCICANRVLVQASIFDEFLKRFVARVRSLKVGEGSDDCVDIGPLIDNRALHKVSSLVEDALAKGAKALVGGQESVLGFNFYEPTVLVNVETSMRIYHEEIFGPIAAVCSFESEQQVLTMANSSQAGLAAYIYTQDMSRIWRFSERLQFGIVGVNETSVSSAAVPFGGVKQSGQGREGSKYGLDDYLELKYVCMNTNDRLG